MLERIRRLCRDKGISIAKLEKDLGFANGSIAKSDEKIQAGRLSQIANYFSVSMEYILYGVKSDPDICRVTDMVKDLGYFICDQDDHSDYYEYGDMCSSIYIDRFDSRRFDICKDTPSGLQFIRRDVTAADFVLINDKLLNALFHILNDRGSLITSNEFDFWDSELTADEMALISLYRQNNYREIVSILFDRMSEERDL